MRSSERAFIEIGRAVVRREIGNIMANFTSEVRRELFAAPPREPCCKKAAFFALLATGGSFQEGRIEFVSENERLSEFFLSLAESVYSVRFDIKEAAFDPKRERDRLTFSYAGEKALFLAAEAGFRDGSGIARAAKRECCALACLKAAFLGGGSCTLPTPGTRTGYHLEFVFPRAADAEAFRDLLGGFDLLGKFARRGERTVVYLKSGDMLSDFFAAVGAEGALRKLGELAAERQERNNSNRVSNCFARNADRTAIASVNQLRIFRELYERGVFESLPEPLREAARARVEHPTESLTELAARLNVSKSCLNHRFRKLMELYKSTEENT